MDKATFKKCYDKIIALNKDFYILSDDGQRYDHKVDSSCKCKLKLDETLNCIIAIHLENDNMISKMPMSMSIVDIEKVMIMSTSLDRENLIKVMEDEFNITEEKEQFKILSGTYFQPRV